MSMKRLRGCVLAIVCFVLSATLAGTAFAAKKDKKYQDMAAKAAADYNATHTDKVETVKTIQWIARTTSKIKVKIQETGETVKIKKNAKLRVIQRDYHAMAGISEVKIAEGQTCYIANKYLSWKKPVCTGASGDYSEATKLAYVNAMNIPRRSDYKAEEEYMIWISLDKQRVNVFKGTNHNWELVKCFVASSGAGESPTLDVTFVKAYVKWKKPTIDSMKWFTSFYGSGIHKFVGAGRKNMGKKPVSHSCVRVSASHAKWIYNTVPLKAQVWIW